MSRDYFVITTLKLEYNNQNIQKIIYKASDLGFIYYDFISGERYEESPILSADQAFERLMKMKKDTNFDDALFIEIEKGYFAHIWFYQTEEGYLQYYLGSFYNVKEKLIDNDYTVIDFKFYITEALKLGDDFGIEKLVADYMD